MVRSKRRVANIEIDMKKLEIICDSCEKYIDLYVIYGILQLPGFPEMNFCGISCFDDFIKEKYLRHHRRGQ